MTYGIGYTPMGNLDALNADLPVTLPRVSRATAVVTYKFLMAGMVARLYLYLFGEIEKDNVTAIADILCERNGVFKAILDEKKPPLRVIYDFLISHEIIEPIDLTPEAQSYLDVMDGLQTRIMTEEEEIEVREKAILVQHSQDAFRSLLIHRQNARMELLRLIQ